MQGVIDVDIMLESLTYTLWLAAIPTSISNVTGF
jgi:hypothetical protein